MYNLSRKKEDYRTILAVTELISTVNVIKFTHCVRVTLDI